MSAIDSPAAPPATPRRRSTFVTVVAWIFIVLSGFATFISVLQNIMVAMFFQPAAMAAMKAPPDEDIGPFFNFMIGNFHLFFLAFLIVSSLVLAASIGLLMRRNWARVLFIAMMGVGIVWNIVGFVLMFLFLGVFVNVPAGPAAAQVHGFAYVMAGFNVLLGIATIAVLAWIVKRLLSPAIRAEFAGS